MRFLVAVLLVCLFRVPAVAAQPGPSPAAAAEAPGGAEVCVRGDDEAGVAEVVAGLASRGLAATPCAMSPDDAWVVDVHGLTSGRITVAVHSPGSLLWRPDVDVDPTADVAGRARAAAVTAAAVLRLILDTRPAPARSPPPGREGVAEIPPPPAPTPVEPAPETVEPSPWTWLVGMTLGAEGNIGGSSARRRVGFDLGLRVEVVHVAGAWLAGQFDWTIAVAERGERLLLETGTPRLLVGAALGTDIWAVRFGLGGAFQGWWTAGGAAPAGWRLGTALATSFRWQALSWLAVGAEAGVDLYRTRVEIAYRAEPVFELDHWRWRAGAWLAGTFASR